MWSIVGIVVCGNLMNVATKWLALMFRIPEVLGSHLRPLKNSEREENSDYYRKLSESQDHVSLFDYFDV
jgi:hypothetical protein